MDDLQTQTGEETQTTEQTQTATTEQASGTETQNTEQTQETETQEQKTDLPESADKYEVNLEGFDFDAFKADEGNKAFLENGDLEMLFPGLTGEWTKDKKAFTRIWEENQKLINDIDVTTK